MTATVSPPTTSTRPSRRSTSLLLVAAGLGMVHQLDHILRYDHSGWPFRAEITPFTFSWFFFVLALLPLTIRRRPWLRLLPVALTLVLLQAAHVFIETPHDQYSVWATGVSQDADARGHPNLLGVTSQALGYTAAGISILLSVLFVLALLSLADDARRATRRPLGSLGPVRGPGSKRFTVQPRRARFLSRTVHLVGAGVLGAYVYAPQEVILAMRPYVAVLTFPVLAITGTVIWKQAQLQRLLRSLVGRQAILRQRITPNQEYDNQREQHTSR